MVECQEHVHQQKEMVNKFNINTGRQVVGQVKKVGKSRNFYQKVGKSRNFSTKK